jgi:hypothetical protein
MGALKSIRSIKENIPHLLELPSERSWIDYDKKSDVLYVSFEKPQHADDSVMEDNIIYHYRGKKLVDLQF